jgi:drug/metabolite transporter (DMT)-like permease
MNRLKGFLALLACAVIFASFSIYVRVLSNDLSAYQQIGFRNIIALVIGLAAVILSKQSFSSLVAIPKKYTFLYTITFPIAVVFFTLSVLEIKIVSTIFGLYLGALITSLLVGITFFKEKMTKMKLLSLILVSLGLITYAYPFDGSLLSIGFLLAILSGVFDATANSFRKYLAGKMDRFVLVVLQMVGGLVVAIGLILFSGQFAIPVISTTSWLVGIIFGISLVAISYLTLVGFQNFDLNLGTVILSSELFFASIFALVFFGEISSFTELLGGTLIILATLVANWTIEKESRLFLYYLKAKKSLNI